eukprot:443754_1
MDACLRSVTDALQTFYINSTSLNYMMSKESHSGLKELRLQMYKAYDDREDEKCFDLGVSFQLKGYTLCEKSIGHIDWKHFMWDWTTKHWSMFLLLITYSLNIKIKSLRYITFLPSHKIQKGATFKEFEQFINDISKEAHSLMKHHKLFRRFKIHKFDVKFAIGDDFRKDVAVWFDSGEWKNIHLPFLYALEMERGAIFGWNFIHKLKSKTKFPSHTYWVTLNKTLIFDNESNKFHRGHRKYIRHRLLSSLSKIERKNSEFMKFIEYCVKFIHDVSSMDMLPVDDVYTNQDNKEYEYENYIRPVYARRVYAKYYLKLSNKISVELLMRFAVDKKIFSDAFRLD